MAQGKHILICPLNWGIGHATRCAPVISCLSALGHQPVIAADEAPLDLLTGMFPHLDYVVFKGYSPTYSKSRSQGLKLGLQIPQLLKSIQQESDFIEKNQSKLRLDGIISDNRYGARSKLLPSVFITHQINIRLPEGLSAFQKVVNLLNRSFINRFDECWVPDFPTEDNLSGRLSHPANLRIPTHYIGPLSRFSAAMETPTGKPQDKIDLLVMLSGPEPQRSMLEDIIIDHSQAFTGKIVVLRGLPSAKTTLPDAGNLTFLNHASTDHIHSLIQAAGLIVSRSGYSTIMDLVSLGKKAYFVPTPGQSEQEFLALRMKARGWFDYCSQEQFSLETAVSSADRFSPPLLENGLLLQKRLGIWMQPR